MKFATSAAALAAVAAAAPLVEKRATTYTDGDILNYALTLEHLENAFYAGGVKQYNNQSFINAGLKPTLYGNLMEIAQDEATHVSFLTSALKAAKVTPVAPCTYKFGYTDPKSFIATANLLEGVGVSAYLGAAQYIAEKAYLTAAGSILTIEARHSAYIRDNQYPPQSPFPAAFDVPLDLSEVYSLASLFITGCPKTNPTLPVQAFPALSLGKIATPVRPGDVLPITAAKTLSGTVYAYFMSINGPVSAPVTGSGTSFKVTVPNDAPAGQSYLIFTNSKTPTITDENTKAIGVIPVQSKYTYGWSP